MPKENLQFLIQKIQADSDSPVTDLSLSQELIEEIEYLAIDLEKINPNPQPLINAASLLDGKWLLMYSTAREIRSLSSLPLGLKINKVYQEINVTEKSFFNIAFVKHPLGLISGSVKVTASFEPTPEDSEKRINVQFDKRYLSIEKILGFPTPPLNPFKVLPANNPRNRTPSLEITYLDENFRIGRGGDKSLFVLKKA